MEENTTNETHIQHEEPTTKDRLRVWDEDEIIITRTQIIKRLTFKNLFYEFAKAFNLHKGFLRTMVGLTMHPTKTIKSYLDTERDLITSPIKYFFIVAGVTLLLATSTDYFHKSIDAVGAFQHGMEISDSNQELPEEGKKSFQIEFNRIFDDYFIKYMNAWTMITIVFISFFSFRFFKRDHYNFVEHFTINTYIYAHSYILFFIIVLFQLYHPNWTLVYMGYYIILSIFIFKQFFQRSWWTTIWKFILAYLLSTIIFYVIIVAFAIIYLILTIDKSQF